MKKLALVTLASAMSALAAPPAAPERPAVGHPLVGTWQWTHQQSNCTEMYDYRANGTAEIVSGHEYTVNSYTVTAAPDANGFYRVVLRTTKDNGGQDCVSDSADNTGLESTNYILFTPDRKQILVCYEPTQSACFGPLRRVTR